MALIEIFAGIGRLANDVLALMAFIGALMILVLGRRARQFIPWGLMGVVFGWVFLGCMALTGSLPARIGVLLGLPPAAIIALLAVSTVLLGARMMRDRK